MVISSKPEPPTNFLTYMTFLGEHEHEVPVLSSVSDLVDRDRDEIGSGATFSAYKGLWKEGKAAFKYLRERTSFHPSPIDKELLPQQMTGERLVRSHPDLASYVNNGPTRLTSQEALFLAADVADGLAALHSFGIVHGDLKPANVLLFLDAESAAEHEPGGQSPRLVAKVGDFGYSGTVSSEDDVRGGTHFWNAPECLDCCDDEELKAFATHQSRDIYSFGLLLVYLWTNGGSPFDGLALGLAINDRAKLDDRISEHCCTLIRNSRFSGVAGEVAAAVEDVVRDNLYRDPRLRCSNIGGVRSKLTSKYDGFFERVNQPTNMACAQRQD
ncbi:MAG: hypothetical protein Q9226_006952 [Calogaya cf. arnoldii]